MRCSLVHISCIKPVPSLSCLNNFFPCKVDARMPTVHISSLLSPRGIFNFRSTLGPSSQTGRTTRMEILTHLSLGFAGRVVEQLEAVKSCHSPNCCPLCLALLEFSQIHLWKLPALNSSTLTPPKGFFSQCLTVIQREKQPSLGTLWGRMDWRSPPSGASLVPNDTG